MAQERMSYNIYIIFARNLSILLISEYDFSECKMNPRFRIFDISNVIESVIIRICLPYFKRNNNFICL